MNFAEAVKLLERRVSVSYSGDKAVRAQCPAHNGDRRGMVWKGGLNGRPVPSLPLYGSELLKRVPLDVEVYHCEGEKDTLNMWGRGIPALGTVTGAGTIPNDDVLRCLVGRDIVF